MEKCKHDKGAYKSVYMLDTKYFILPSISLDEKEFK